MRRRLFLLLAVATVAGALVYVARPAGHIPPYDANLIRLAESDLQGYCAGEAFWLSGGEGDGGLAADCRKRLAKQRSNAPNTGAVVKAFCRAVKDQGWTGGTAEDCQKILASYEMWPTYQGGLTDQWNRARKYPGRAIQTGGKVGGDGSRTGGHTGGERPAGNPRGHMQDGEG